MKIAIIKQKVLYSLATTTPLAIAATLISIYLGLVGVYSATPQDAACRMELLDSIANPLLFHCGIICGLIILVYLGAIVLRWLPTSMEIPKGATDSDLRVRFSTADIFSRKGELVLSYNRNNLIGGVRSSSGEPNLMAQFLHRYFPLDGDDDLLSFNFETFERQYKSEDAFLYYLDENGKVARLKTKDHDLISCYAPHHKGHPERSIPQVHEPEKLLPEGTVLALPLPENPDKRKYAFLLCNTWYELPSPDDAHPSLSALSACLKTLWKTVTLDRDISGRTLCIPFLGKGTSNLAVQAYALLWEIVFSWRQSRVGGTAPTYSLDLCITAKEMLKNKIKFGEVIRFLTYALKDK